jgi:uncharacterized protein YjbI with pentapeptide repeats
LPNDRERRLRGANLNAATRVGSNLVGAILAGTPPSPATTSAALARVLIWDV